MALDLRDSRCFPPCARCTAWSGYSQITIGVLLTLHSVLAADQSGLWPEGTYGLPRATELHGNGCPRSCNFTWFDDGFAFFDTRDDNNRNAFSNTLNLFGMFKDNIELHFCMKTTVNGCSENVTWPTGCYCLFKFNDCPFGFESGEINWNGGSNNRAGGVLPNGTFNPGGIRLNFCCRCDGSITIPINLPMDSDFFLMADRRGEGSCQRVSGFDEDVQYVVWDSEISTIYSGGNPAQKTEYNDGIVNISFCYYTPHLNGNASMEPPRTVSSPDCATSVTLWMAGFIIAVICLTLLCILYIVSMILCICMKRPKGKRKYADLLESQANLPMLIHQINSESNQHTIRSYARGSPTNGSLSGEYHYPVVMTSNPAYEQTELEREKLAACGQDPHS